MKAWELHEPGDPWTNLVLSDVDSPTPGAGEVLVDVEGTDLNFADILQCQGQYQVKVPTPFVPGMNTAGTIVAVGSTAGLDLDVKLEVGQRVVGWTVVGNGGFAQQALMGAEGCTVLPDEVSSTTAVAMHVTYGTSWFALHRRGNLQPGESVLVLAAAGGVGSSAVQMAKAHGCWVLAAAGGPDKTAVCTELGADVAIDYSNEDLYERVMAETSGRGVDVIYDPVGGDYFDVSRRLLAWEGRLLIVGFASGRVPQAPMNHALVKNYSLVGVHMGGYREADPSHFDRCYQDIYQLLLEGKIDPLIGETVALDDLPRALKDLAERRTTGRVLLDPRL